MKVQLALAGGFNSAGAKKGPEDEWTIHLQGLRKLIGRTVITKVPTIAINGEQKDE